MTNRETAQKIVDRIVELINEGRPLPWVRPWGSQPHKVEIVDGVKIITLPATAVNRQGKRYNGANVYLPAGEYITFHQCKKEGGSVKKGAKGWPVVFWKFLQKETTDPTTGEVTKETIPMLKYYVVFNVEDCDGIKPKHTPAPVTVEVPITHTEDATGDTDELNDTAEQIIADYVNRAGNGFHILKDEVSTRAYYSPALDYVQVPMRAQFNDMPEYYSTLFHELGHSTGHSSRLNRFEIGSKSASFGSESYSREELVAETTSATILNALGLETGNTFRNSSAYIKGWAEHIKSDPMLYVTAATRAQQAVDMILGIDTAEPDDESDE